MSSSALDAEVLLTPRCRASQAREETARIVGDFMMDFDLQLMRKVRADFERTSDGAVDLDEFVDIMQQHVPKLRRSSLRELFLEIDVNGDSTLEWDELTSFFVEKSSVYEESGEQGTTFMVPFKHDASFDAHDQNSQENEIDKLFYIEPLDTVAVLHDHSRCIHLYDARDLSTEIGRLTSYRGMPICVEHVPDVSHNRGSSRMQAGRMVTSCSNLSLSLWTLQPGEQQFSVHSSWPVPHAQSSLCWINGVDVLYSGSVAGTLHAWNIEQRTEQTCILGAHGGIVTALAQIDGLDCVASGGMDSEVAIWDVHVACKRQRLSGHESGVYTLEYNSAHRLLFSGGIDHEALVWTPFSRDVVYKLKGHKDSLTDIHSVPGSDHQVITGDASGVFKLWDVRTFGCLQTFMDESPHFLQNRTNSFVVTQGFDMQHHEGSVAARKQEQKICNKANNASLSSQQAATAESGASYHAPYLSRLIAAGKCMQVFDQCDPVTEMVTDNIPIIAALINTVSMTIITATTRTIKIWNLLTGKQMRQYNDLVNSDVTSVSMDDRQRKFLLGDHAGNINVFNYSNGVHMKPLEPHNAEVSKLIYCAGSKNVVSVSWDRAVVVHSEDPPEHGLHLREMDTVLAHEDDITCADVLGDRIATGSSDKTVRVWDYFSGKLCNKLQCGAPITAVQFLPVVQKLCAADRAGRLHIWALSLSMDDEYIQRADHDNLRMGLHIKPGERSSMLAMSWENTSKQLIMGDEYGSLRAVRVKKDLSIEETWSVADAHEDGITCVNICAKLNLVVTSSFDCCVRAFSLKDGTAWGTLINGAGRGVPHSRFWNVPFSEEALKLESEEEEKVNAGKKNAYVPIDFEQNIEGDANMNNAATDKYWGVVRRSSVLSSETVNYGINAFGENKAFEQKDAKTERREFILSMISTP